MKSKEHNPSRENTRMKGIPVFITAKMVQHILEISSSTAYRYLNAAKAGNTRSNGKVTFQEFADYLEIPLDELHQRLEFLRPTG